MLIKVDVNELYWEWNERGRLKPDCKRGDVLGCVETVWTSRVNVG